MQRATVTTSGKIDQEPSGLSMTLAIILLFVSWTTPASAQDPATSQSATPPSQSQSSQPPAQNPAPETKPSTAPPAKTSSPTHPRAKRPVHKKKVIPVNCVAAPAAAAPTTVTPAASDPPGTTPPATGSTPAASGTTTTAPTNCPPPKTIVRQGGTAEPSIQLAGGDGGIQEARQRDTANQMLGATEQNLKKIAGLQLSQDQQGIVTQVRQFMEQSKNAAAAGDLERARTLAWKAQLLSEELIKPQK